MDRSLSISNVIFWRRSVQPFVSSGLSPGPIVMAVRYHSYPETMFEVSSAQTVTTKASIACQQHKVKLHQEAL